MSQNLLGQFGEFVSVEDVSNSTWAKALDRVRTELGEERFNAELVAAGCEQLPAENGTCVALSVRLDRRNETLEQRLRDAWRNITVFSRTKESLDRNASGSDILTGIRDDVTRIIQTDFLDTEKRLSSRLAWRTKRSAMEARRYASEIQKTHPNLSSREAFILRQGIKIGTAIADTERWADLWPPVEALQDKNHKQKMSLKQNSAKAVTERRSKAENRRKLCRDLAHQHIGKRSISRAAARIGEQIKLNRLWNPLPSHRTIMNDIRDLFPSIKSNPTPR